MKIYGEARLQEVKLKFDDKNISVNDLEKYEDLIKELYYDEGVGAARIAFAFGLSEQHGNRWLKTKKGATAKIVTEILGYDSWDEYNKEHKKIHSAIQSQRRYDAGFTEALKEEIKQRDDYKCQKCGAKKNLEVHHKDGNWKNNNPKNLITLCKNCHKSKHKRKTYRSQRNDSRHPTCSVCGLKLANPKALIRHRKKCHNMEG